MFMIFSFGISKSFLIKTKKRKSQSEVGLCIICPTKKPKENVIKEPKLSSIKNLISVRKDTDMAILRLQSSSVEQKSGLE